MNYQWPQGREEKKNRKRDRTGTEWWRNITHTEQSYCKLTQSYIPGVAKSTRPRGMVECIYGMRHTAVIHRRPPEADRLLWPSPPPCIPAPPTPLLRIGPSTLLFRLLGTLAHVARPRGRWSILITAARRASRTQHLGLTEGRTQRRILNPKLVEQRTTLFPSSICLIGRR